MSKEGKFYFAIDRGGTFTDVICICPNGNVRTLKLLSVDPDRYADAPREGIRRILAEVWLLIYIIIYKRIQPNVQCSNRRNVRWKIENKSNLFGKFICRKRVTHKQLTV